jgi:hypothetical protein
LHVEYDSYKVIEEFSFLNLDLALMETYEDSCDDDASFKEDREYASINKVDVVEGTCQPRRDPTSRTYVGRDTRQH